MLIPLKNNKISLENYFQPPDSDDSECPDDSDPYQMTEVR